MNAIAVPPMLIEQALPSFDAVRAEHRIVRGEVTAVYDAVRRADFMRAWRESPAVRVLFSARSLAERAVSAARGRAVAEPPPPASLRLADLTGNGEWVLLGEDPPREIAFGAIGRFWGGETIWEEIDAADFTTFDRPGYGRIACNFSLRPYGSGHALVSYECRTQATDPAGRRAFLRYWRPLSPFIGVVLRAQLGVVAAESDPAGSARFC
jgi:hypothetical protein